MVFLIISRIAFSLIDFSVRRRRNKDPIGDLRGYDSKYGSVALTRVVCTPLTVRHSRGTINTRSVR